MRPGPDLCLTDQTCSLNLRSMALAPLRACLAESRVRRLEIRAHPADGRVRRVNLTRAGLAERAELDRRSDDFARGLLEPLGEGRRARLVAAMEEVERLLGASAVRLAVEDPTTADARWCVGQYFSELDARFEAGFDPSLSISPRTRAS